MEAGESDDCVYLPPSLAKVKLLEAPVLFFVVSHKAFRSELASIRRAAAEASESVGYSRELVCELARRLEFLKLVYNYHCAAEDEVIFLALDEHVKNVVPTYSLEHKSIDNSFCSIFHHLDLLMKKDEAAPQMFQELVFSIGTVQTMFCQHMQKEEEQVFPLLMEKFSLEEQSQLVWQYMCSVPVVLLEEFLLWMTSHLSSEEKVEVLRCVKVIIPKERVIQEVFVSWLQEKDRSCSDATNLCGKGYQFLNELSSYKNVNELYPPQFFCEEELGFKRACSVQESGVEIPIKSIHHWHAAINRDFNRIIQELYQIRSSNCFSSLPSVVGQLKFAADVLIFYSNSLDKIFYPLLSQLKNSSISLRSRLIDGRQTESLQKLLFYKFQSLEELSFVDLLSEELDSLLKSFSKSMIDLETEVLPFFIDNCTQEMQLWLLYTSLHIMPLGLLMCTVTWFSAHLSNHQSNSILTNITIGCPLVDPSFTSLLHEWVRVGSSGKTSVEKFQQTLHETFNGRSYYLNEKIRQTSLISDESNQAARNTSVQIESCREIVSNIESRPMDHIFLIHRALVKDLESLVSLSDNLAADVKFLDEFKKRFNLFHNIYRFHSDSEDEIVFPALESRGALRNIGQSYTIDHKLEVKLFEKISAMLDEISGEKGLMHHRQLCLKLQDTCLSMHKLLSDHIHREEVEIFPRFIECFSIEEEEKIVGHMLGRTKAEILQEMIPWLMAYLTRDEQHEMMCLWRKVTKYTNFDEWLGEWWEGANIYKRPEIKEGFNKIPSLTIDPLEVVSTYLMKEGTNSRAKRHDSGEKKESSFVNVDKEMAMYESEVDKKKCDEINDRFGKREDDLKECHELDHPLSMSQEELEATIRKVSRDSTLDSQKKSYIMQNLLMSRWMATQNASYEEGSLETDQGEIPGQSPSYKDPMKLVFGCKHYTRNCKLLAPCCNKLYTCIRCHDELTDHSVDRTAITKMMCMKCLVIQPIGPKCTTSSCNDFSMARYYCRICKLFDDERQIYHCPYCNLCRVGKGLGVEYFHCMNCNACMKKTLFVHACREKCLEDNCPICHEYVFTSYSPVKALPCGHLMHSACFEEYTCSHYICPICSKSLGDMQVYFGMLDALLAEEKIPEDYARQIQVILCNDCEKRGNASFHWLYHKCSICGSYNTRLL